MTTFDRFDPYEDCWRPIETAPRDTYVIICFPDSQREIAQWRFNGDEDLGWWSQDGLDFNYGYDRPVYWLPLPPAPLIP
jgi:hypothetical protein